MKTSHFVPFCPILDGSGHPHSFGKPRTGSDPPSQGEGSPGRGRILGLPQLMSNRAVFIVLLWRQVMPAGKLGALVDDPPVRERRAAEESDMRFALSPTGNSIFISATSVLVIRGLRPRPCPQGNCWTDILSATMGQPTELPVSQGDGTT